MKKTNKKQLTKTSLIESSKILVNVTKVFTFLADVRDLMSCDDFVTRRLPMMRD